MPSQCSPRPSSMGGATETSSNFRIGMAVVFGVTLNGEVVADGREWKLSV